MRERRLEKLDELGRRGVLVGDREQRPGAQHRRAQILVLVGGEVEEVRILAQQGAFGEIGRDEAGLTVHHALRRHVEQTLGAVAEVGRRQRVGLARDVVGVEREIAELLDRGDDARVVEGHLVGHPLVIDLGRLGAQHQVLDPVGRRPAGGAARSQADAPGRLAVLDHPVHQRLQLFHRLGHFVAEVVEVLGDVPDQRLDVHVEEEAVELIVAGIVGIGAQVDPGLAGGHVLAHPVGGAVGKRLQEPAGRHVARQARLREHRQVGGRACLGIDHDLLLERVRADIVRLGTGRGVEIGHEFGEGLGLGGEPRPEDRQALARQVGRISKGLVALPVEAPLARRDRKVHMRVGPGAACRECNRGSACQQVEFH